MRKRTRRKVWALRDPISHAMSGARKVSEDTNLVTYSIKTHASMEALVKGVATKQDMSHLAMANNMVAALMKQGFATPHAPDAEASANALDAIAQRARDKGRVLATGPEIVALNQMLAIHDAMFDTISVSEYNRAVDYVNGVFRSGNSHALNLGELK